MPMEKSYWLVKVGIRMSKVGMFKKFQSPEKMFRKETKMTSQHSNGTLTKSLKLTPLLRQYRFIILTALLPWNNPPSLLFVANDRQGVYWKASAELLATVTEIVLLQ